MSYRVENLLLNREMIRAQENIDSDDFNDLILVEKKLNELIANKSITQKEIKIVNIYLNCLNLEKAQKELGMSRLTISKIFTRVCERVSTYLGYSFTDEGFIEYMTDKYRLNKDEISRLKGFISSKYRHKTAQTLYKQE
jgi:AraC-like DNA-binding protein